MDRPFVTTYSDILFTSEVVRGLVAVAGRHRARRRHRLARALQAAHPASAARRREGDHARTARCSACIATIPYEDATGEFIGVAKFSARGGALLREHYHRRRREFWDKPYREAAQFQKAYLIHLFQDMIEQGVRVRPCRHARPATARSTRRKTWTSRRRLGEP